MAVENVMVTFKNENGEIQSGKLYNFLNFYFKRLGDKELKLILGVYDFSPSYKKYRGQKGDMYSQTGYTSTKHQAYITNTQESLAFFICLFKDEEDFDGFSVKEKMIFLSKRLGSMPEIIEIS